MRLALELILPILLIVCALAVTFSKRLLVAVVIFTSFSLIMSVIWVLLESPDLAITGSPHGLTAMPPNNPCFLRNRPNPKKTRGPRAKSKRRSPPARNGWA